MKRKKVLSVCFLCLLLLLAVLGGCSSVKEEEKQEDGYQLYYVNEQKTKVISQPVEEPKGDPVESFTKLLFEQPVGEQKESLLPKGVELLNHYVEGGSLWLDFNEAYGQLDRNMEILIRASAVKTYVQIPEINNVGILVEGQRMTDSYGEEVALMDASSFVENSGKEINAYSHVHLTLYFSNEEGNKLVAEDRSVYYSTSMPLERVIIEQLLKGPREEGHYATIPPETKVLGVTVADGVCYVNLGKTFSDITLNQMEEIPIYSITNSLVKSGAVNQVQISVNGETKIHYRESISLDQMFRMNTDLIEKEAEDE